MYAIRSYYAQMRLPLPACAPDSSQVSQGRGPSAKPSAPSSCIFCSNARSFSLSISCMCLIFQSFVLDPVRLIGIRSQAALAIGLVISVIAFEPDYLTIPLESQNMGGNPVQEPAIV